MENREVLQSIMAAFQKKAPVLLAEKKAERAKIGILDNGLFVYYFEGEQVCKGCSAAKTPDGRTIDTRCAEMVSWEIFSCEGKRTGIRTLYRKEELWLKQELTVYDNGAAAVQIFLHDESGRTETRYLAPFITPYPDGEGKELFLSLDQKMLIVPYDNDMWSRYESAVPACGRQSCDVTAIYDECSMEGLVIGAVNFDVWKNAICWAAHDARSLIAYCGAADAGTHDSCPHGIVSGEWVASAPFVFFWSPDIRDGMEQYGDMCAAQIPARPWKNGGVPFGWNSYSALALGLTLLHWREAGDFMRGELPDYCGEDGVTYVNLDGAFGLDQEEIRRTIERLHGRGQKAGWYASPCNWFEAGRDMPIGYFASADEALSEEMNTKIGELFLRDERGSVMPAADGTVPLDVTHPMWEKMARAMIRRLTGLGIDYLKLDFLSHGSVEGAHYRKGYTGRMALNLAYRILSEEIDAAKRDIFVSLSIAPLFPYFLGNARRSCCDTFGHHEDVRYVLNALNFAWWTNGRIYRFNDPDHVPLYLSAVDGRCATAEAEARSRYYASAISGTVMMLSDNYGPEGDPEVIRMSRARAKKFADDAKVNAIARLGKAFVPVELKDGTTPFYTLSHEGTHYAAVFNFTAERRTLSFLAERGRLPAKGTFCDIHGGQKTSYDQVISVELEGWDAVILEIGGNDERD